MQANSTESFSSRALRAPGVCGALLLVGSVLLAGFSTQFRYGTVMAERPILPMVTLMMLMALAYFGAVYASRRLVMTRRLAWWILAVGSGMRLIMATSQPILEDDFYRYLWDGALTAQGINPYGIRPADVQAEADFVPRSVLELGRESGIILQRVNHPALGTIYPPGAQAVFAIAHVIAPWQPVGLLVLYYAMDCAVFALLIALLRALQRPPALVLIYWWNPLLIKEVYNSLHMDILVVPFLLLSLLLVLRERPALASFALAIATAMKLWPALLLIPLLATLRKRPTYIIVCAALFGAASVVMLAPMLASRTLGSASGLAAYGMRWEMNDALFMIFPALIEQIAGVAGLAPDQGTLHRGGKMIAAGLLLILALALTYRNVWQERPALEGNQRQTSTWLWIAAGLFLLSPTQFPWYFLWFAPLLALAPSRGLLLLTLTMPLYYLKFYLDARGQVTLFHDGVVWVEYLPVWLLLAWDWGRRTPEHTLEPDGTAGSR